MRLGQLARQLQVTPKDILTYVENNHQVEIKTHPNSKIPDELIGDITNALGKADLSEEKSAVEPETVIETPKKKDDRNEKVEVLEFDSNEENSLPEGKVEAEIPTIEGPKIVGKIDLPERELNRVIPEKKERPVRPKRVRTKPKGKKKTGKRAETDAERRTRELKELAAKRKASAESLKQLNKEKYLEKTKRNVSNPTTKKKKKAKKSQVNITTATPKVTTKKKPSGVFGKLWSWLNDA